VPVFGSRDPLSSLSAMKSFGHGVSAAFPPRRGPRARSAQEADEMGPSPDGDRSPAARVWSQLEGDEPAGRRSEVAVELGERLGQRMVPGHIMRQHRMTGAQR